MIVIERIPCGDYKVNTYLVACAETNKGVIIDPGGEPERLAETAQSKGIDIEYILNTHGHADHVEANEALKQIFSASVGMHEADDDFFSVERDRKESTQKFGPSRFGPADMRFRDGDEIRVGNLSIEVLHTPGHTPGSCCYLAEGNLFTGDTLFVGDAGRTDLRGGSLESLLESLEKKIMPLPPETVVWPGHDYGDSPASTVGREIEENPYITDFLL